METLFDQYKELNINGSLICLEQVEDIYSYFCYPTNAKAIGFEGSIMYCFIEPYGEMVFACNPDTCADVFVYPLARTFEDFMRLILACGSTNPIEQIIWMEIRKEERKDWTRAGQNRGTSQDLKAVSEALSYLRQKGLSTVEDLEAFLESSGKSAADYRNQMKPKEARSKVIDGILASRTDCKECKPVYEKYQKIFFKKTKEKFKQEHPEVARYERATAYLAKHPDDKDSTQKELQEEQETLLEEIAELKVPLTEVQEDLKKLRDIRYWVRKATPGTEESKEPTKKQPIKEVLQDKADEKKAQRTAPAQAKHRQQDMEL